MLLQEWECFVNQAIRQPQLYLRLRLVAFVAVPVSIGMHFLRLILYICNLTFFCFFCSSNTSVKENNKSSSRFAVPKLPLKRSKSKLSKGDTPESGLTPISDYPELIGKLEKEEEKPSINPNQLLVSQSPSNLLQQAVNMQKQSAEGLMSLLRIAGKAYSHLTSYESRLVIDAVELFSPRHKRSSWVLSLMAKAYFELADYKQAAK